MVPKIRHLGFALLVGLFWPAFAFAQSAPDRGEISAQQIHNLIAAYLDFQFAEQQVRWKLKPMTRLQVWRIGMAVDSIVVVPKNYRLSGGYVPFKLAAYREGKIVRTLIYAVQLKVFRPALVASQRILPRTVLQPEMFVRQYTLVSGLQGTPLTELSEIQGKVSRRMILAGRVITRADVMDSILVERGENITLQYRNGNLHLELKARALQDGCKGEVIWLLNPVTRRRIQGRVVDRDLAIIP